MQKFRRFYPNHLVNWVDGRSAHTRSYKKVRKNDRLVKVDYPVWQCKDVVSRLPKREKSRA